MEFDKRLEFGTRSCIRFYNRLALISAMHIPAFIRGSAEMIQSYWQSRLMTDSSPGVA